MSYNPESVLFLSVMAKLGSATAEGHFLFTPQSYSLPNRVAFSQEKSPTCINTAPFPLDMSSETQKYLVTRLLFLKSNQVHKLGLS